MQNANLFNSGLLVQLANKVKAMRENDYLARSSFTNETNRPSILALVIK